MKKIKNVIVLGMYPYPWRDNLISDTMRSMAKAFTSERVIFINPSVGFRKAIQENHSFSLSWVVEKDLKVTVITPPMEKIPSSFGLGKVKSIWSNKSLDKTINSLIGDNWRRDTLVYISSGGIVQSYNLIRTLNPNYFAFDILDDNLEFPNMLEKDKKDQIIYCQYLIGKSTVTTAVSEHLVNKFSKDLQSNIQLLPNGVNLELFLYQKYQEKPLQELSNLKHPILGFVGALTSWIDFELLLKVANHPDTGSLVLVGPIIKEAVPAEFLKPLIDHPKVLFTGPVPYHDVPKYLYQFDMLLLPRNYEPHSLASDPLKLYEYMATGKPIISTTIPTVSRFSDILYLGKTHQDILKLIGEVKYSWNEERAQKSIESVNNMSWENRTINLKKLVEKEIKKTN